MYANNNVHIQGLDKIMETLYCTHFFINMVMDQLLPSIQPQPFMEWTRTSFEQSLVEFYTALLEEHLQVVFMTMEVGICSSI
jgi:hypothetical protein